MGPDKWVVVRDAIASHDVKGTLFYIPLDFPTGQPLRLKEFELEAAMPYVYERFIEAWGMVLHHDQVPLYLSKHIYRYCVLNMHPYYTSTPSSFYGVGRGHSHAHLGAMRDPRAQPKPNNLVIQPSSTMLRTCDVADSSKLETEEHSTLA